METGTAEIDRASWAEVLPGTFGDKSIAFETYVVPTMPAVIVNIHGAYGAIHSTDNKYQKFAVSLRQQAAANVVLYASSRLKPEGLIRHDELDYTDRKQLFKGKTLDNEVEDLKIVLRHVINDSSRLFGVKQEDLKLVLNGNSLGGIIALSVAPEFGVMHVSIVGTGLYVEQEFAETAIDFPSVDYIAKIAAGFRGTALVHHGTEDKVFCRDSVEALADAMKNAAVHFIDHPGVDHSFSRVHGEHSEVPYKEVERRLVRVI